VGHDDVCGYYDKNDHWA
jgi:hypothetical protein